MSPKIVRGGHPLAAGGLELQDTQDLAVAAGDVDALFISGDNNSRKHRGSLSGQAGAVYFYGIA